ncbi:MAG: ATP-binding protein [Deltaproteobacteria bacterium]|nr:ATP-binding protein [Deltaproteobacteria bacterium]
MKRLIEKKLTNWRLVKPRKPLILRGARQVGKTFTLKEFGKREFRNCHYLNFEENTRLANIFAVDLNPKRILNELRFLLNRDIDVRSDLLIFDEIQQCGCALTSLKYFCEELPELAICAAGSLLGVILSNESFPVGKVTFYDLYPMNYHEFLLGIGERELANLLATHNISSPFPIAAHERFWDLWKHYLVVGGLPAVVMAYAKHHANLFQAIVSVRKLQSDLINAYSADIAKHSGKTNALHVDRVWRNVPQQLARTIDDSAPKYRFKDVLPGIRGYERLSGPINWLIGARLIIKTAIVETASLPLSAYASENNFKLYFFDVAMLSAISNLPAQAIFDYNFGSYKGYIAENFIAQEMLVNECLELYCWKGRTSEIEFLYSNENELIPIEVKSGKVTNSKSLKVFIEKYHAKSAYVFSGRNSEKQNDRINIPLYAAGEFFRRLGE